MRKVLALDGSYFTPWFPHPRAFPHIYTTNQSWASLPPESEKFKPYVSYFTPWFLPTPGPSQYLHYKSWESLPAE